MRLNAAHVDVEPVKCMKKLAECVGKTQFQLTCAINYSAQHKVFKPIILSTLCLLDYDVIAVIMSPCVGDNALLMPGAIILKRAVVCLGYSCENHFVDFGWEHVVCCPLLPVPNMQCVNTSKTSWKADEMRCSLGQRWRTRAQQ